MKIFLIILAAFFGLILLLLICPTKVCFFYNEKGENDMRLLLKILGVKIKIYPQKPKKIKPEKPISERKRIKIEAKKLKAEQKADKKVKNKAEKMANKTANKAEKVEKNAETTQENGEKPAAKAKKKFNFSAISVDKIIELLHFGIDALGKFRRIIKIEKLKLYASIATENPANTAIAYGAAAAAVNMGLPYIKDKIKIKKTDIFITSAFDKKETDIEFEITISAVLIALIIAAIKIGIKFLKIYKGGVL